MKITKRGKTGALISSGVSIGPIAARSKPRRQFERMVRKTSCLFYHCMFYSCGDRASLLSSFFFFPLFGDSRWNVRSRGGRPRIGVSEQNEQATREKGEKIKGKKRVWQIAEAWSGLMGSSGLVHPLTSNQDPSFFFSYFGYPAKHRDCF